ncbi:EcsC family protein [Yoonia sp.]|uniref:EcsC family protein n=1 Tax=Yoonia sp. TaxID=2212373 RepID=UPI0019DE297A|nr:EcsC family protein [Yoonia sp.]MBE0412915.1 EcsC family protein [Yoonia sp.]
MENAPTSRTDLIPAVQPVPLDDAARQEIALLALRQHRANGVLMKGITFVGGQVEDGLKMLPASTRNQFDAVVKRALRQSYDLAHRSRSGVGRDIGSDGLHKLIGTLSGALGGFGGIATAMVELPVATTVIFRAVHHVATQYGEDPESAETRMQCLAVFGTGGPGRDDDGIDTAFIGARLGLSGAAVNGLISRVAPRLAAVLSQKLAAQTVPVLGAAAGAGINYAFVDYYVALAHVHFGLRKLGRTYGQESVTEAFHRALVQT